MKRTIAMLSTGVAIGFALALANADDTARSGSKDSSAGVSENVTTAQTCIDAKGIIHRPGTEAYSECQSEKERVQKQMAGELGEETDDEIAGPHSDPVPGDSMPRDSLNDEP